MEGSELEIGWDPFLGLLIPQGHHPRSPQMLAFKVKMLEISLIAILYSNTSPQSNYPKTIVGSLDCFTRPITGFDNVINS